MNRHVGKGLAHHHDQAGIRHDQCIRTHCDNGFEITNVVLQLVVVRGDIAGEEEALAGGVRFLDALGEDVLLAELVVAYPQAVAGLAGIDRVSAVRERVAHILEGAGRREQFGASHGVSRVRKSRNYIVLAAAFPMGVTP